MISQLMHQSAQVKLQTGYVSPSQLMVNTQTTNCTEKVHFAAII